MRDEKYQGYISPLSERYPSKEMQYLFSAEKKFQSWRKLWIALAEAEMELGLSISQDQIEEMKAHALDINYGVAAEKEKELRHDVMSHVFAYGVQCPKAKGIIHWGATSCYVGDNTDLLIMKEALELVRIKILNVVDNLAKFALKYKDLPTLGYTHFQPAQPVTLGKRASLWIQDLMMDYDEINHMLSGWKLLGSKGTTGTQASFLHLFDGDRDKVRELDRLIVKKLGVEGTYPVSGQTYSRKLDAQVLNTLGGVAISAHKFSNDLRLAAHLKELEEPFEKGQVGSSAMAYKRNPMRAERMAGLSRHLLTLSTDTDFTAAGQWFERTLDDSANKRISVSEAFLALDAILELYINVTSGLVVYPKMIERHLLAELPFMATETILMEGVKRGKDRQLLHERIRIHSMEASRIVKEEGGENDLLQRISEDSAFGFSLEELMDLCKPEGFVGMAPDQTQDYIDSYVKPLLKSNESVLGLRGKIQV